MAGYNPYNGYMSGMNNMGMSNMYPNMMNPSPYQYPSPSQFGQGNMIGNNSMNGQNQQVMNVNNNSTGPDWIQVPTIDQVEQVSVQPGCKAWVMTQDTPVFALRVADNMGLVTTDYYRFEKVQKDDLKGNSVGVQTGDYITRDEAERMMNERINAFVNGFMMNSQTNVAPTAIAPPMTVQQVTTATPNEQIVMPVTTMVQQTATPSTTTTVTSSTSNKRQSKTAKGDISE